jgi:DNA-binding transcriptional LysR family regulator
LAGSVSCGSEIAETLLAVAKEGILQRRQTGFHVTRPTISRQMTDLVEMPGKSRLIRAAAGTLTEEIVA